MKRIPPGPPEGVRGTSHDALPSSGSPASRYCIHLDGRRCTWPSVSFIPPRQSVPPIEASSLGASWQNWSHLQTSTTSLIGARFCQEELRSNIQADADVDVDPDRRRGGRSPEACFSIYASVGAPHEPDGDSRDGGRENPPQPTGGQRRRGMAVSQAMMMPSHAWWMSY